MPGQDGLQIAEEIKRLSPTAPIVIITGYAEIKLAVKTLVRHVKKAYQNKIEDAVFDLKEALFEGNPGIIKDLTGQLRELLKEA